MDEADRIVGGQHGCVEWHDATQAAQNVSDCA
jgi:hypothetical protein